MRIVGGTHRGRNLLAPETPDTRPTSDKVREAVFDILAHNGWGANGGSPVGNAIVLDAFCGTGALALEAISRGADLAFLLDTNPSALATATKNIEAMKEQGKAQIMRGDATKPPLASRPCSLIFLDPPYRKGLIPTSITALRASGWIAPNAIIVAETAADENDVGHWLDNETHLERLSERRYGDTNIIFLRHLAE